MDAARRTSLTDAAEDSSDYPAVAAARPPGAPLREGRPPRRAPGPQGLLTTFRVIHSYLWLRFWARWRSDEWVDRRLRAAHLRNARRIERPFCELQGLFIKVGQVISIMTNFCRRSSGRQLEGLQDHVPPRPYPTSPRASARSSPASLTRFASFDRTPVASASIGQVHRATLKDGLAVAVKVQYPDIDEIVRSDLRTLRRIFRIVQWFVPYQGLDDVYREIRAIVLAELDFRAEADNGDRIAANFTDRRDVAFPRVVRERSTARVLTTRFEAGVKILEAAGVKAMGSTAAAWPGRWSRSTRQQIHRRRLPRRPAPREPARPAARRRRGRRAGVPGLRRGRDDPPGVPAGHRRADPGRPDPRHTHGSSERCGRWASWLAALTTACSSRSSSTSTIASARASRLTRST
ncbi:MAG: AarF/ABC1/UbiB kinase family protein [Myxococcales bacterium]|nr:AarF/ABC1/UbiB kinase family protein [Myxococcales bacterium]